MVDIDLFNQVEKYEFFQNLRPDYREAIAKSVELAFKYTKNYNNVVISDFCCGTGSNTKKYADLFGGVEKALLIDINNEFLKIAKSSKIKSGEVIDVNQDILKYEPLHDSDIVLSIFAYHHLRNKYKKEYINKIKKTLKDKGFLILTEIFLSKKELVKKYYEKLISEIPESKTIPDLKKFLLQTSNSSDFEFKVSKKFSDEQFASEGFELIEEVKIWPLDGSFEKDIGTFVQIYKIKK